MERQLDLFNPDSDHLRHPDELIHLIDNVSLHDYGQIYIMTSTGKDSSCAIWETMRLAAEQDYPIENIILSHQDLGEAEWPGVTELLKKQADYFGLEYVISRRVDKNGYEESLLEFVKRRRKFMSSAIRYCTSNMKRDPGERTTRRLANESGAKKVLQIFGFRKDESPARAKRPVLSINKRLTTKTGTRVVHDYLPIHDWSTEKVWETIKSNKIPYHKAYDLGMPRLSCVFCIFSPRSALILAGQHNPELLDKYIQVEDEIGHTFKKDFSLHEVKAAIESGEKVESIEDWVM